MTSLINPDLISGLPHEALCLIGSFLPPQTLRDLGSVSRLFDLIVVEVWWRPKFRLLGAFKWDENAGLKKEFIAFSEITQEGNILDILVARNIGPSAFLNIKPLRLECRKHPTYMTPEFLFDYKAALSGPVRRVETHLNDEKISFLFLRVIDHTWDSDIPDIFCIRYYPIGNRVHVEEGIYFSIYHGSKDSYRIWDTFDSCFCKMPKGKGLDFIGRLLNHEPCGRLEFNGEHPSDPNILQGKAITELF